MTYYQRLLNRSYKGCSMENASRNY